MKGIYWLIFSVFITGFLALSANTASGYDHQNARIEYREYSPKTFALAKSENKPVFLVLSASWCYWCKVYQSKTLEKVEVAKFLNKNFVNVFVDLDKRQDLHHLYARKAIPTSVLFHPDGRKLISFTGVLSEKLFLEGVGDFLKRLNSQTFRRDKREGVSVSDIRGFLEAGKSLKGKIRGSLTDLLALRAEEFQELAAEHFDSVNGGFGQKKKYPMGLLLAYLADKKAGTRKKEAFEASNFTLGQIGKKLQDQVAGGFHRYAGAKDWRWVFYEKMLTTNLELALAYTIAAEATGKTEYRKTAHRSTEYVLTKLFSGEKGAFHGSQDGKNREYYKLSAEKRKTVKTPLVDPVLYTGQNARAVYLLFEINHRKPEKKLKQAAFKALDFLMSDLQMPDGGMYGFYDPRGRKKGGVGFLKDNAWSALAFAKAYQVTGQVKYRLAFARVFKFMKKRLYVPSLGMYRRWNLFQELNLRKGEALSEEVPLEENGWVAFALIKAFQATGNKAYKNEAERMLRSLGQLELDVFDEDPFDSGKRYLESFVPFFFSLEQFSTL